MVREFVLVDLYTQMPYLPRVARTWSYDRFLAWLRVWGEIREIEYPPELFAVGRRTFAFRSWVGLYANFVLTDDGQMFVPGSRLRAWPENGP
jgi:hypothetical protein